MKHSSINQPGHSSELEKRLKQVVTRREQIEHNYRANKQKFWAIAFMDVSVSATFVYEQGENVAKAVLANYQTLARQALQAYGACFIEPGGGPQLVCCFEDPALAIEAAGAVIQRLHQWNDDQDERLHLLPAVGIHHGYINYHNGQIHQSNTNNLAKRIQSEAAPGQILVSSGVYEALLEHKHFQFAYLRTAQLKNIPEPEAIYQARVLTHPSNFRLQEQTGPNETPRHRSTASTHRQKHDWVFVFIDVSGSTKKFWSYGDREASELIERYQAICHEAFKKYHCAYLKSCEGDQIVACYEKSNADGAISAAILILQALFRRNITLAQHKQVRAAIGIHAGEAIVENDELVATADMRVGKGIQSQADADEILLSQDCCEWLSPSLRTPLTQIGWHEFSGLPDTYLLHAFQWFRVTPRPPRPRK